jgi:hypothetical protein
MWGCVLSEKLGLRVFRRCSLTNQSEFHEFLSAVKVTQGVHR